MPSIFPIYVFQQGTSSNTGSLPAGSCVISDAIKSVSVATAESNVTPTDLASSILSSSNPESNVTPTETVSSKVSGTGISEGNATPAEFRTVSVRYWASSAADNDSSRTTPANSVGANNGTVATIKTNLATADTTNPVILTMTIAPPTTTGTWTTKQLRIYFQVAAAPGSDTIKLLYNIGAGDVTLFTATAAVNNLSTGAVYDVSSLTLAQLQTLTIKASYQSAVVLTPSTALTVDAAALELVGTL